MLRPASSLKYILNNLTEINWSLLQPVQFIQSAVYGEVAHKVKDIVVLLSIFLIKLKHLLSASNKTSRIKLLYEQQFRQFPATLNLN